MIKAVSWSFLIEAFRRRWAAFFKMLACFILLAILYANLAMPRYEAVTLVAPTSNLLDQDNSTGLSGLSGSGIVSSLIGRNGEPPPGFSRFMNLVSSRSLAVKLLADEKVRENIYANEWDAQAHRWHRPTGFAAMISGAIKRLLGAPSWQPPDASEMATYVTDNLEFTNVTHSDLYRVSYRNKNPVFARYFLDVIYSSLDSELKAAFVARHSANLVYIDNVLEHGTNSVLQTAMTSLYVQEQRRLMLASSSLPFSADIIDPITVSDRPVTPNLPVVYGAAIFLAIVFGLLAVILLHASELGMIRLPLFRRGIGAGRPVTRLS